MPLKIIDFGSREYEQMLQLRNDILRKPLGFELSDEDKQIDHDSMLIAAFEDDVMLGCCMLVKDKDQMLLRQMAVKNDLQGKGIGRALMNFAETLARDTGHKELLMYARSHVKGFYERLGYKPVGDEFLKLTIPHVTMKKRL